jgi:hypothetical protein
MGIELNIPRIPSYCSDALRLSTEQRPRRDVISSVPANHQPISKEKRASGSANKEGEDDCKPKKA